MPATITSQFRLNNAKALNSTAIASNPQYWIGIGKSDGALTTPPRDNLAYAATASGNLIMLKRIQEAALMYPANIFVKGRIYKAYDPGDNECFYSSTVVSVIHYPCYVNTGTTGDGPVFLCLKSPLIITHATTDPSWPTSTPGGIFTSSSSTGSGDYAWSYLYSISSGDKLNSSSFKRLPTTTVIADSTLMTETLGKLIGIRIDNAGAYSSAPTVKLHYRSDSGSGVLSLNITFNLTYIASVTLPTLLSSGAGLLSTSIISHASVVITGGGTVTTNAVLRPILTPVRGVARDLTKVFPCWHVGFYGKLDGVSGTDLMQTNSYSQISLVKDPLLQTGNSAPLDANLSLNCLRSFSITLNSTNKLAATAFTISTIYIDSFNDVIISQSSASAITTDGATAIIDYVTFSAGATFNSGTLTIYFHQNPEENFAKLNVQDFTTASASTYIHIALSTPIYLNYAVAITEPEYKHGSGEVLFLENRSAITRTSTQTEEIKIVIQL